MCSTGAKEGRDFIAHEGGGADLFAAHGMRTDDDEPFFSPVGARGTRPDGRHRLARRVDLDLHVRRQALHQVPAEAAGPGRIHRRGRVGGRGLTSSTATATATVPAPASSRLAESWDSGASAWRHLP